MLAYVEKQEANKHLCHPFAEPFMSARAILARIEGA
jgi:hypothetical protein